MSNLLKNILIALAITLVIGAVFMVLTGEEEQAGPVTATQKTEASLETERILADIQRIKEYDLDDSILEDIRFTTLSDFRVNIVDVPTGRSNPFDSVE